MEATSLQPPPQIHTIGRLVAGLFFTAAGLVLTAFEDNLVFFYSPTDLAQKPLPPETCSSSARLSTARGLRLSSTDAVRCMRRSAAPSRRCSAAVKRPCSSSSVRWPRRSWLLIWNAEGCTCQPGSLDRHI